MGDDESPKSQNINRLAENGTSFLNKIDRIPSVESRALSNQYLSGGVSDWGYQTVEDNPRNNSFINLFATADFLKTMDIELIEGRGFNKDLVSDTANILINEKTKKWLGGDVLGKVLSRGDGEDYTIIGVVKDFNHASLRRDIDPFIFRLMGEDGKTEGDWYAANYLSLKVTGALPEGPPRHFCNPTDTASSFHASTSSGLPPIDAVASQ